MHVLGELMTERDGLGMLQVGEAGRVRRYMLRRLVEECALQVGDGQRDAPDLVAQVQPEVGGHLVVPAPTGAKLAAEVAKFADQRPLDGGVHILVGRVGNERPCEDLDGELVKGAHDGRQLRVREEPGTVEHPRMGTRLLNVVGGKAPVEVRRQAQRSHGFRRTAGEPSAPQAGGLLIGQEVLLCSATVRRVVQ
jgi:hypothetical protein